jgi:hypothetical protein
MLVLSGVMKIAHTAEVLKNWGPRFGFPEKLLTPIGAIELLCAVLYLVPKTSVLGAILIAGYFGGAVATHVRLGEPDFIGPLLLAVFAWGGLFLRDPRVRALIPLS